MTEFLDTLITNNKQYGYIFIKNISRLNELWDERGKIQFIVKMYYMLLSIYFLKLFNLLNS